MRNVDRKLWSLQGLFGRDARAKHQRVPERQNARAACLPQEATADLPRIPRFSFSDFLGGTFLFVVPIS
jgi:hypothetical protein